MQTLSKPKFKECYDWRAKLSDNDHTVTGQDRSYLGFAYTEFIALVRDGKTYAVEV